MKVPVSWLREYVDISLPIEELAHRLTLAGLEVEAVHYVGLPMPTSDQLDFKRSGLSWDPEKIVVGDIEEVRSHPDADRLVLCDLDDGERQHQVLTGAPNLFPYKGLGKLALPLKVAYAREGATIIDAYTPGENLVKLKRRKIRGVESYSMACSERELGISDEHEGIILLETDAPAGTPLVEVLGDAVLDIAIIPNIARDTNIIGVAREIAAITDSKLKLPENRIQMEGPEIAAMAGIEIREPELNPRFTLGLIQGVEIKPSPMWVQRRLRLAGMRPINNIVDATNYVMLEVGEPLHAFDYDVLCERAGKSPKIITRLPEVGERLTTLDEIERSLDEFTVLVCDEKGPLSIAGVMGGLETEVTESTTNVLLEGAAWNFINIRKTLTKQRLDSEASYRFSRGVHPSLALDGLMRGLHWMQAWSGGAVAQGVLDAYPLPPHDPVVAITQADVLRWLGVEIGLDEIASLLTRLAFHVEQEEESLLVTTPDHRMDIGEGVIGTADLMEEIARVYGYDRIPETRLSDDLPLQRGNSVQEREDQIRDILTALGLQEVMSYRMTTPEREARLTLSGAGQPPYVRLANPISSDRTVMRRSLLNGMLEIVGRNARVRPRLAIFEIGPVFLPVEGEALPDEPLILSIALTGMRELPSWKQNQPPLMDFYDLKGTLEELFLRFHLEGVRFSPAEAPAFHPGRAANIHFEEEIIGILGELHPVIRDSYSNLPDTPILAAELDLGSIMTAQTRLFSLDPVPGFPPVLEDLAVVVDDAVPAETVAEIIREAGGKLLVDVRLFDLYRGEQLEAGKKSLAYALTYQAPDRTLTDETITKRRKQIISSLEKELKATLRA
ncbi:MAG: phenylalanine--tRNA ligase subunit beta [Anaerolineales bacterium]|nr:phenylalanine--tRNA ligase subunit beta [Anaerolineales bacterium]